MKHNHLIRVIFVKDCWIFTICIFRIIGLWDLSSYFHFKSEDFIRLFWDYYITAGFIYIFSTLFHYLFAKRKSVLSAQQVPIRANPSPVVSSANHYDLSFQGTYSSLTNHLPHYHQHYFELSSQATVSSIIWPWALIRSSLSYC